MKKLKKAPQVKPIKKCFIDNVHCGSGHGSFASAAVLLHLRCLQAGAARLWHGTAQPPHAHFSPCVWWACVVPWPRTRSWLLCSADRVFGNYLLFLVSARILKLDLLNNSFTAPVGSRIFLPFEASETGEKSKPGVSNLVCSLTVKGNASHSKPWRCERLVSFSFHSTRY